MSSLRRIIAVLENGSTIPTSAPTSSAQPISMACGEDVTVEVTVRDQGGVPVDLNGRALTLTVARTTSGGDAFHLNATNMSPTSSGVARFTLASALTRNMPAGRYVYDVWMIDEARVRVVPASLLTLAPAVPGRA